MNHYDYLVFFGFLAVSAGIGLYCRLTGGRQKTNEEFLLADRKQNPICVAISLMANFMSAISIVSGVAEHYVYGTHFFTINVGNCLGIVFSLIFFNPTFYKLKIVSIFRYLELRFGSTIRLCASLITTVQMLLYISIALVAPVISLRTITNMSPEMSILLCGFVCVFYASLGGMKAIIITDIFQSLLMFASMFAVIFTGYTTVGSFGKIMDIALEGQRIDILNFSTDLTIRHSWWSTVIGGFMNSLYLNGITQTQIQRYSTMSSYKTVVISALCSAPIITALSFLVCVCGITIFAVYAKCDPIRSKKIPSGDRILLYYVTDKFHEYPGLSGVFVSGIFSASLSTVSPILNSLAAVTVEDYMMPLMRKFKRKEVEPKSSFFAQIFTLVYGIACILISLLALNVTSLLQAALVIFQLVGGPMVGIFSLGIFTSTANEKGTLVGFFVSIISMAWLFMIPKPKPQVLPTSIAECSANDLSRSMLLMYNATTSVSNETSSLEFPYIARLSYLYYGLIGFVITFVLGYATSYVLKDEQTIDPSLLHEAIAKPLLKKQSPSTHSQTLKNDLADYLCMKVTSVEMSEF